MHDTWVAVAGGPSLTLQQVRALGMARAAKRCSVIAVNDAVYPCWFADVAYACDRRWWHAHGGVVGFPGIKVSLERSDYVDVTPLTKTGNEGFDPDRGTMRTGGNSGYQAVHFAGQNGAKRIVLVAYDFKGLNQEPGLVATHWFGPHPVGLRRAGHSHDEHQRLRRFRALTDELQYRGVTIINATIDSAISWLPRQSIEEALA